MLHPAQAGNSLLTLGQCAKLFLSLRAVVVLPAHSPNLASQSGGVAKRCWRTTVLPAYRFPLPSRLPVAVVVDAASATKTKQRNHQTPNAAAVSQQKGAVARDREGEREGREG